MMSKFWELEIEESKQFRRLKGSREEEMSAVEKPLESQPPCGTEPGKVQVSQKWGWGGGKMWSETRVLVQSL